jgi:hypothetical protein
VYDPSRMTVSLRCSSYFHPDDLDWQMTYFTHAVAIQAAQAHAELDLAPSLIGGVPAEINSAVGPRTNPDDMLNVLHLYAEKGKNSSAFTGKECSNIEKMLPAPFVMANSSRKQATAEFPSPGSAMGTALLTVFTDAPHPKLGNGALLLLRISGIPGVSQNPELANTLNLMEMQKWNRCRSFGAWCHDSMRKDPSKQRCSVCLLRPEPRHDERASAKRSASSGSTSSLVT